MDDLISRQAAIDALSIYGSVWMEYMDGMTKEQIVEKARVSKQALIEIVEQLPPARLEPCNYVNACNELAMNNTSSTYGYLQILKEFEKYGYILVDAIGNIR